MTKISLRNAVLTPVPHRLAAGHWAFSPGGSLTAFFTGKGAKHVLKHAKDD